MREKIECWGIGQDLACEKTPFFIARDKKKKKDVMKGRAMAYVIDLNNHLLRALDHIEK